MGSIGYEICGKYFSVVVSFPASLLDNWVSRSKVYYWHKIIYK